VVTNPTSIHKNAGLTPGFGHWVKDLALLWELQCRLHHSWDLALLRLWCRPAAAALIRPIAWELAYAAPVALRSKKKKVYLLESPNNPNLPGITLSPEELTSYRQPPLNAKKYLSLFYTAGSTRISAHVTTGNGYLETYNKGTWWSLCIWESLAFIRAQIEKDTHAIFKTVV